MKLFLLFEGVNAARSTVVHGGGTYSRWLTLELLHLLEKKERLDISIHVLWPYATLPTTKDEMSIYYNNSLIIDEVINVEDAPFSEGDKLFIPILESCRVDLGSIKRAHPGLRIESVIHGVRNYDLKRCDAYQKYYHAWYKPVPGMGTLSYIRQLRSSHREVARVKSACAVLDMVYTDSASSMALISRLAKPKRINYYQPLSSIPGSIITEEHPMPSERYILSISANRPEKNVIRSLVAFSRYKRRRPDDDIRFYVVGANETLRRNIKFVRNIDESVVRESVRFLGYISSEELAGLFRECFFLLYPSRSEGFGLPLLDAMIAGRPAVTSLITSMPEVLGSAAYYVDPYDTGSIERGIEFMSNQANNERYTRYTVESRKALLERQRIDSNRLVEQILFG